MREMNVSLHHLHPYYETLRFLPFSSVRFAPAKANTFTISCVPLPTAEERKSLEKIKDKVDCHVFQPSPDHQDDKEEVLIIEFLAPFDGVWNSHAIVNKIIEFLNFISNKPSDFLKSSQDPKDEKVLNELQMTFNKSCNIISNRIIELQRLLQIEHGKDIYNEVISLIAFLEHEYDEVFLRNTERFLLLTAYQKLVVPNPEKITKLLEETKRYHNVFLEKATINHIIEQANVYASQQNNELFEDLLLKGLEKFPDNQQLLFCFASKIRKTKQDQQTGDATRSILQRYISSLPKLAVSDRVTSLEGKLKTYLEMGEAKKALETFCQCFLHSNNQASLNWLHASLMERKFAAYCLLNIFSATLLVLCRTKNLSIQSEHYHSVIEMIEQPEKLALSRRWRCSTTSFNADSASVFGLRMMPTSLFFRLPNSPIVNMLKTLESKVYELAETLCKKNIIKQYGYELAQAHPQEEIALQHVDKNELYNRLKMQLEPQAKRIAQLIRLAILYCFATSSIPFCIATIEQLMDYLTTCELTVKIRNIYDEQDKIQEVDMIFDPLRDMKLNDFFQSLLEKCQAWASHFLEEKTTIHRPQS